MEPKKEYEQEQPINNEQPKQEDDTINKEEEPKQEESKPNNGFISKDEFNKVLEEKFIFLKNMIIENISQIKSEKKEEPKQEEIKKEREIF